MTAYTIFLNQKPNQQWRAVVHELPDCVAEATTRDEVLQRIKQRVTKIINRTEVVRMEIEPELALASQKFRHETPWDYFGSRKGEDVIARLYDEIEQQRDAHTIGG